MIVSENIRCLLQDSTAWNLYVNRSYQVTIRKADKTREYNVPGKPGVVYNILEDSYAEVNEDGLVVTGVAGEMWPIGKVALKKYRVNMQELSFEPLAVSTIETGDVYCGLQISLQTVFTLEADYGVKVTLTGNHAGIAHGGGDYVLVAARQENGRLVPDFTDSGRIVNGAVFEKLYRPYEG